MPLTPCLKAILMGMSSQLPALPGPQVEKLRGQLRLSRIINVVLALLVVVLVAAVGVQPSARVRAEENQIVPVSEEQAENLQAENQSAAAGDGMGFVRRVDGDPLALGAVDAPVIISQWTDYRCPYCALFANQTLPVLLEQYVDSGQVRIEFNDVYFFGDDSRDAAVAARAAAEQGYYQQFIEVLYAAAPEKGGHPDMPRDLLVSFAEQAGVPDLERFQADLDSPQILARVEESHQQALELGISSVPFFVVGDQAVAGAQPLEVFTELIEAAS